MRVRNGTLSDLADAVRAGTVTLNYAGRTSGKRPSSAAMTTAPGSYNTAKRVALTREPRTHQVKPLGAPRTRRDKVHTRGRQTDVRMALRIGSSWRAMTER